MPALRPVLDRFKCMHPAINGDCTEGTLDSERSKRNVPSLLQQKVERFLSSNCCTNYLANYRRCQLSDASKGCDDESSDRKSSSNFKLCFFNNFILNLHHSAPLQSNVLRTQWRRAAEKDRSRSVFLFPSLLYLCFRFTVDLWFEQRDNGMMVR